MAHKPCLLHCASTLMPEPDTGFQIWGAGTPLLEPPVVAPGSIIMSISCVVLLPVVRSVVLPNVFLCHFIATVNNVTFVMHTCMYIHAYSRHVMCCRLMCCSVSAFWVTENAKLAVQTALYLCRCMYR